MVRSWLFSFSFRRLQEISGLGAAETDGGKPPGGKQPGTPRSAENKFWPVEHMENRSLKLNQNIYIYIYPYAPCMEYLPTFAPRNTQM